MFRLFRTFRHGSTLNNYVKNSCRTLYSSNSLGIDSYVDQREKVKHYFLNDADRFREKMKEFAENNETSLIFTEDLKNMVHLADPSNDDLQLLEGMLRKFNKQSKETRFGNFFFGPVLMRFFHHIKKPDEALKLFKDPDFDGFFDQPISYQILCDMLYEQGRYRDVIDVFEVIREKQIHGGKNPRHVVLLVSAACYKENTPESFKYCSDLFVELNRVGHEPIRRALTFAAALALKQNAPDVALEIVGTTRQQHYVTVRNIKASAFASLGRPDDALVILKGVLQLNDTTQKHTFTKDTVATVKDVVYKSGNNELKQNYDRLEKHLMENGHLDDKTLEDILTIEIDSPGKNELRKDRSDLTASYNSNTYNNRSDRNQNYGYKKASYGGRTSRPSRPGLDDMY